MGKRLRDTSVENARRTLLRGGTEDAEVEDDRLVRLEDHEVARGQEEGPEDGKVRFEQVHCPRELDG